MSSMYKFPEKPGLRPSARAQSRHQRGVTLMELLVGLTIGLLVVVAALGSLAFTQITSSTVGDSARLQQKADIVFRIIGIHTAQAGGLALVSTGGSNVAFSSAYTGFNPTTTTAGANQLISVHGVDGTSGAPDTLRVSYQDNGVSRDCLGNNSSNANVRMDQQFSVTGTDLMCLGSNTGATAQSLADGVEDFQVLYGVSNGGALQYLRADQLTAAVWPTVQTVSICLQLQGENVGNPTAGLDLTGCNGSAISSDGRLHRVYLRTFSLRNL